MNTPNCLATALLLAASSFSSTGERNLTADELIALVRTSLSKFESIQLRFSSRSRHANEDEPNFGVDGIWVYRNDGYELLKLRHVVGTMLGREESHSRDPESNRSLVELGLGERKGAIVRARPREWEVHSPGMPRRFFVLPFLLEREEHIRENYVPEGWEVIDGHRCFKFSVLAIRDPTKPQFNRRDRFWLDLERGGHALRWEWWVNDRLALEVSDVRLRPLEGGLWMPVHSREEGHWKRGGLAASPQAPPVDPRFKVKYKDANGNWMDENDLPSEVHTIMEITVAPASIEVNGPIQNRDIELTFPVATQVIDEVDGKRFFQGDVRPTPTGARTAPPSQENLDELIAKAESQRDTIEASSRARSGWGFWTIILMACVSTLLIVGGLILMQRRGA